ncbi:non-ribosomal peptide synthetase, partial [Saccharothrix coeruleofusca]|uniref:non-ribosomal peptide synthetase n=1 Tax=Saccharothrix coeruleofusca TaxID=33919 RepID=UPI0016707781
MIAKQPGSVLGPLPDLVGAQAARTPDAVAVLAERGALTYRELIGRADRLARVLRERGHGPESVVGVCLERGPELAVALLGAWRAGAAYLPVEPAHPVTRLAWTLSDSGARTVLTQPSLADKVREAGGEPLLLDGLGDDDGDWRGVRVRSDQAAYVSYTSGSTGRPKGVVITHGGIANRVSWTVRTHGLAETDRVVHKTSMAFDAACWEVFAPLISGGTVVMAPTGAERDPALLTRTIAEHRVTVLQVVPTVLRALVDDPGWRDCGSLRLLFSAGEPLHAELCQRALAAVRPAIWNTYGPTECSIDITAHEFDPDQHSGPVPIGRAIDHGRVLVLDRHGEPAPVGVPGELHLGGVGLARGYLGRPDLTAERFVPDPFGRPGARLYRTGDLGRLREDGTLDYLGRSDHQVKVNGVRIEPAEVEAALTAHPDVRAAVVVVTREPKRLAAYVVADREIDAAEHREFLRARLPEALVPAVFVALPELPTTTSGKVDRTALPDVDATARAARPEHEEPADDTERAVAGVWRSVLGVERVGAHDDFFQLGGTSILLTGLANRLRDTTGADVRLADLFVTPTVREQARLVAAGRAADAPIVPEAEATSAPLSTGQTRLWFLDRLRPGSLEWVTPVFLRIAREVGEDAVAAALNALETRHDVLRTTYAAVAGRPVQRINPPGKVELTVVDGDADGRFDYVEAELARGFDLADGPVWRALLTPVSDTESLLLLTIHHIACDGWSSVVLERELRELLAAQRAGREPNLPPLAVRYADYAVWQRRHLSGDRVERDLAHWRGVLADLAPLELPTDRPRPVERDARGGLVALDVPPDLAERVVELGRGQGATPFMTFLTCYAVLLARYTGQSDVAVGSPVAGRDRPEVADLVGFFLNNVVLRCDLDGDPTFEQALRRVREVCREAFAHQEAPFDRVVDALEVRRDLSRTPLYQVAFDFHEEGATGTADHTADVDSFAEAWAVAKTDLTVLAHRRRDGGVTAYLEFAAALFDRSTVERFGEHFLGLLRAVAAEPTARLSALEFVGPGERALLLHGGEGERFAVDRGLHAMFAERVAMSPDAPAVVFGDEVLTYRQLNARANQLARYLVSMGVRPGSLVGVCLTRSANLVVALLGVLKAGGAYLPLDPAVPAERLRFMAEDAAVPVVLGELSVEPLVSEFFDGAQVLLDDVLQAAAIDGYPTSDIDAGTGPDDLIYMIYTSGSTGRPKGVYLTHRNVARLFHSCQGDYAFGRSDVLTLFHSYAFDMSVWELWGALLYGGKLVVVPQSVTRSPDEFLDLLVEHRVTVLNQTPSAFKGLVDLASTDDPRLADLALRAVTFGGEKLEMAELRPWVDRFGTAAPKLVNMYGITETTVHSTYHEVSDVDVADGWLNPIGRPLADLRIHLLDRHGRLVPVGVPGEIHVGGPGVAVGYWNRP